MRFISCKLATFVSETCACLCEWGTGVQGTVYMGRQLESNTAECYYKVEYEKSCQVHLFSSRSAGM